MPLTRYGLREWATILIVGAIAAIASFIFIPTPWNLVAGGLFVAITVAMLSFFRDPIRTVPQDLEDGKYLAPADGTISAIVTVDSHEATGGEPAIIIRILLTVLNVHVNRAPCPCTVRRLIYNKGQFISAMLPVSADVNEATTLVAHADWTKNEDETFGIRQIAGKVARRIVCDVKDNQKLARGEKYGMIKFGSTTELILPRPDDVTVHVEMNQLVRGGKTVIATSTVE